ncbi:MAG: YebC/PmpR family DNA-binding transcriptional regulator [Myxococcota bacterium]
MGRFFEARKSTILARSDRVAKAFSRVSREIVIAVKAGGPEADYNPALRRALQNAKAVNMPKDKIQAAIKRAEGQDVADFQELIYEGYAPHGVAVMAVAATDNPTRTIANVRVAFKKGGGTLGNSGSVAFGFTRMGVFNLDRTKVEDAEELELELIDHGLEEMGDATGDEGEALLVVRTALEDFGRMQEALEARKAEVISSGLEFIPQTTVSVDEAQTEEIMKLLARLEADEDVQHVFTNMA